MNIKILLSIFCSIVITCFIGCNHKNIADVTIDKVSKELVKSTKIYDELDGFHDGLACVGKDKKYGFIDKLGNEIISCQYDNATDFHYGVSIVEIDGKKGIVDLYGNWILPCNFDFILSFGNDSLAVASLNEKMGLIDVNGKTIIPFKYEDIGNFSEGLAWVKENGLYGFINREGETIIPCIYDNIYSRDGFSEGLVGVEKDRKWGYIDKIGQTVIQFQDGLTGAPFSCGVTTTSRGGLSLSMDSKGNIIETRTPFEMAFINHKGDLTSGFFARDLEGFRDGYCRVIAMNGWVGLINLEGNYTIPCKYTFIINGFDDKYVVIGANDKFGFAKKSTGEIIIPCIYEEVGYKFCEGLVPVKKSGKYGYINEENEIVIPFVYDYASSFSEGFAIVQKFGKYGFVDRYGNDTFYNL